MSFGCRFAVLLSLIAIAAPGFAQEDEPKRKRRKPKAPPIVDTEVVAAPEEKPAEAAPAEPVEEEAKPEPREPRRVKKKRKKQEAPPEPIQTSAALSGRLGLENIYFLETERMRHERLQLNLKQTASFGDALKTTIDGRFRADGALYPSEGSSSHYPKSVRDDEMSELELRQGFIDWMVGEFRLKVGVQQIDWVESLSPKTSDVITPLDLRHGGFGTSSEIIEPVFAINANHPAPKGALEWLVVPNAKMHRTAEGPNGYGYTEMLDAIAGPNAVVDHRLPQKNGKEVEGGLRYLLYFDRWDASLLAYRGHQRSPAMRLFPLSPTQNLLIQDHPRANTFGTSVSMSTDAFVGRFFVYYEPNRRPALEVFATPALTPDTLLRSSEDRVRGGFGLDYVHSKHFKIYTETVRTETVYERAVNSQAVPVEKERNEDYVASLRITNETFTDWVLAIDASFFSPERAQIVSPEIQYTYKGIYRATAGARLIRSFDTASPVYYLKDSSQAYLALTRLFNVQ